eukprot:2191262-Rhodomonas_salina.2
MVYPPAGPGVPDPKTVANSLAELKLDPFVFSSPGPGPGKVLLLLVLRSITVPVFLNLAWSTQSLSHGAFKLYPGY